MELRTVIPINNQVEYLFPMQRHSFLAYRDSCKHFTTAYVFNLGNPALTLQYSTLLDLMAGKRCKSQEDFIVY